MRIGIHSRSLLRSPRKGLGNYLHFLFEEMIRAGQKRQFFLYHHAGGAGDFPSDRVTGRTISEFPWRFHGGEQFWLPLSAVRDRIDLLHCPANTLPVIQPCPTVVTVHDMILTMFDEGESRNELFYWRKVMPVALRKAARIITVSEWSRRDVIRLLGVPEEKVRTIHSGVNPFFVPLPPESLAEARAKHGLPGNYLFVLGASSPRKNIRRAVEAFIRMKREGFDPKLVMTVSDAAFRTELEAMLESARIQGEVVFLPHVDDETLRVAYGGASLFLYPSLYEGFGFPVLEAMACGTAVVVSDAAALPEVAGEAALYIHPTETESIIEAVGRLCDDSRLRRELRLKGLQRASSFRWASAASKTLDVYEDCLG